MQVDDRFEDHDNYVNAQTPPQRCIRPIIHLWPQHLWRPAEIYNVLMLEYPPSQFSKTLLYRHLQMNKEKGRLEQVNSRWTMSYGYFEITSKQPQPEWFKKWPFLREVHYHEAFNWDAIKPTVNNDNAREKLASLKQQMAALEAQLGQEVKET